MKDTENFKDPNQLDLFAGILFTPEQEKLIENFIIQSKGGCGVALNRNTNLRWLLLDAGFKNGIDFRDNFELKIVTKEITLGSRWNNNEFKTTCTYETYSGGIELKGLRFTNNELKETTFGLDVSDNKVQCLSIQNQYRYIKPKTLLEKLNQHNECQKDALKDFQNKTNLKQIVVEKYTKLYPNATITIKSDWTKYSGSFEVIEVKFDSGSYIQFKLDTYNNKEYMYKKLDAEFDNLNSEELLNRFSKQVKKEASN